MTCTERERFKAIVFDVDGVLTEISSIWRFIHEHLGTLDKAKRNAQLFYEGKITYEEWAYLDAKLWAGVSESTIKHIVMKVPLKPGVRELADFLKKRGLKIFAISAGLDIIREKLSEVIELDDFVSNTLVFENGRITGEVIVKVNTTNKGEILKELCEKHEVSEDEVIAVGDNEVDVPMFQVAGLSIAFNPTILEVAKYADVALIGDLFKLRKFLEKIL